MSPEIFELASGLSAVRSGRWRSDVWAVGSILQYFKNRIRSEILHNFRSIVGKSPLVIWGSGSAYECRLFTGGSQILALRGKLTQACLEGNIGSIPLGDPGLLVSRFVGALAGDKKEFDVGVIPHFVDSSCDAIRSLPIDSNIRIIDVTKGWRTVASEISSCKKIISSSLHGLVVADSYGIPTIWAQFSDKVYGGGFKFHDYNTVFERNVFPFPVRSPDDLVDCICDRVPWIEPLDSVLLGQIQDDLIGCLRNYSSWPANEVR